jgi:hypothetical protein
VRGQSIFRHQLLGNLPRKRLIDAAFDVESRKLIELKLSILNAIVGPEHCCPQPPDAAHEVALRVQAKTAHEFLLITLVHSFHELIDLTIISEMRLEPSLYRARSI